MRRFPVIITVCFLLALTGCSSIQQSLWETEKMVVTPKGTYLDDGQSRVESVVLSRSMPYQRAVLLGFHYYRVEGQTEQCPS